MNGEPPSISELSRAVRRLEDSTVSREVFAARHEALDDRLERLEEAQTWAYRFIIVLVLSTIGNLLVAVLLK